MITTGELMRLRGLKYRQLVDLMKVSGVSLKSREVDGYELRCYLTADDVKVLLENLEGIKPWLNRVSSRSTGRTWK